MQDRYSFVRNPDKLALRSRFCCGISHHGLEAANGPMSPMPVSAVFIRQMPAATGLVALEVRLDANFSCCQMQLTTGQSYVSQRVRLAMEPSAYANQVLRRDPCVVPIYTIYY